MKIKKTILMVIKGCVLFAAGPRKAVAVMVPTLQKDVVKRLCQLHGRRDKMYKLFNPEHAEFHGQGQQ